MGLGDVTLREFWTDGGREDAGEDARAEKVLEAGPVLAAAPEPVRPCAGALCEVVMGVGGA